MNNYDTIKILLSFGLLDEDIHLQNDLWQAINDAYELLFLLWFSPCYRVIGGYILAIIVFSTTIVLWLQGLALQ